MQFECGTRILRVIHGRDAHATSANCITTKRRKGVDFRPLHLYLLDIQSGSSSVRLGLEVICDISYLFWPASLNLGLIVFSRRRNLSAQHLLIPFERAT